MPFWSKDAKDRIDETVAHVVAQCPPGERATIKTYLDGWIAANFINKVMQKAFSKELSTHGVSHRGDKATRAGRRALVILRSTMLNAANPLYLSQDGVMQMPSGQVAQALAAMIPPFRIFALQEQNNNTQLQAALTELTTQTVTFLQNNFVVCQSWGAPPGGVLAHRFLFDYKNQQFMMLPPKMGQGGNIHGAGITIDAVNVPEIYWAKVPGRGNIAGAGNFGGIVATPLANATLMVTSAFSGCSFCFKDNGGSVFAAHVSPATPNDPSIGPAPALATQLAGPQGTGDFASPQAATAGALQVFGRGFSNLQQKATGYAVQAVPGLPLTAASMYVFGVLAGNSWQIYSQENNNGTKTVTRLL